jgi:hypothetical protein
MDNMNSVLASSVFGPKELSQIRLQTIDVGRPEQGEQIWDTLGENIRARAWYIPGSELLITNNHVVESLCNFLGCPEKMEFRDYHNAAWTKSGIEIIRCSQWLDVCVLRLANPGKEVQVPQTRRPAKDDAVYTLAHSMLSSKAGEIIQAGKIVEDLGASYVSSVRIVRGYSGSPVFNSQGEVVGILSSFNIDKMSPLRTSLRSIGDPALQMDSNFTDLQTIQSILLCPETSKRSCKDRAIEAFVRQFAALHEQGRAKKIDPLMLSISASSYSQGFLDDLDAHGFASRMPKDMADLTRVARLLSGGRFHDVSKEDLESAASSPSRAAFLAAMASLPSSRVLRDDDSNLQAISYIFKILSGATESTEWRLLIERLRENTRANAVDWKKLMSTFMS